MFGLPEKYVVNKKIDIKTFIRKDLKPIDRKRLKETLKSVVLTYQIYGEEIPSVINNEYNCQVILFLDIEVNNIKDVSFVGKVIQEELKTFCVMNIYDKNTQRYVFAEKRLNMQDVSNIVIENIVITKESSIYFYDEWKEELEERLAFNKILSRDNKVSFYRELMTKAFIISEYNLNLSVSKFLDSRIWYKSVKVKELFNYLKELEKLQVLIKKENSSKEKVAINKNITNINDKIMNLE